MLRAASLLIVIVISLVVAIFSASLITVAYFYRLEVQKNLRFSRLTADMDSGIAISLADTSQVASRQKEDLFDGEADSVLITKDHWGIFNLNTVKTWLGPDSLKRVFLSANGTAGETMVICLADEDRPLSISGDTRITGDVLLPKSGIRAAYINGMAYTGKEFVNGGTGISKRTLPPLHPAIIDSLLRRLVPGYGRASKTLPSPPARSFYRPVLTIRLNNKTHFITGNRFEGRIEIHSDTVLTIGAGSHLENVLLFARAIVVEHGFKGRCQLFARDSIVTGRDCVFEYPSAMAVLKADSGKIQAKIKLGTGNRFSGTLLAFEKKRSPLQTLIGLGTNTVVKGDIYSTGYLQLEPGVNILGSATCNRFMMKLAGVLYENFLIDVTFNRRLLGSAYLASPVFYKPGLQPAALQWLN